MARISRAEPHSDRNDTVQVSCRIVITADGRIIADSDIMQGSESVEVTVPGFKTQPMTEYSVHVEVTDNYGRTAAVIDLPGMEEMTVGSGIYDLIPGTFPGVKN